MTHEDIARALFILGACPFLLAGALHALGAISDAIRPRFFTPVDGRVRESMLSTGIAFHRGTSVWRAWLGFNISHGLGAFFFGLLCLLVAADDFDLVRTFEPLMPLAAFMSVSYFLLSIRFWFYGPATLTGFGAICFALSYALL